MNMDIKLVITEQELDLINRMTDLANRMAEQLPESHQKHCAANVSETLHVLCDECYLDLQNGTYSSHPVSEAMWDEEPDDWDCDADDEDYDDDENDCFTDEIEEDDDERPDRIISPNGAVFEIDNPQDIPDDVWDKMMELILGL